MIARFRLILDGVPYDIERKGGLIVVNGLEFTWSHNGDTVAIGANSHVVEVSGTQATVDGMAYTIEVEGLAEPKTRKSSSSASAPIAEEAGAIMAIMPGLIIQVNKQEGEHVEAGEVIIVLEAMKMQNELRAPHGGLLKQVNVKKGDTVEMRQVLAVIE